MIKIKNKKYLIGGMLILFIIIMSVIVFMNKDTLFESHTTIEYSDGCIEKYVGTELITPECTYGRMLIENNGDEEWANINLINLTD